MQAFAIESADAEVTLLDLPTPAPADGEVLVKVRAGSVNGFDLAVAAGMLVVAPWSTAIPSCWATTSPALSRPWAAA
jgi:NADPH:quinone reductase-like Zn-dependent oxidoreductase